MTPSFSATVVTTGRHSIVRLIGVLDLATVDELVSLAIPVLHSSIEDLAIDLAAVEFCDSNALSGLLKIRSAGAKLGVTFQITNASPGCCDSSPSPACPPRSACPSPKTTTNDRSDRSRSTTTIPDRPRILFTLPTA